MRRDSSFCHEWGRGLRVMSLLIKNLYIGQQVEVDRVVGGLRFYGTGSGKAPVIAEISREILRIVKDFSGPGMSVGCHAGGMVIVDRQ